MKQNPSKIKFKKNHKVKSSLFTLSEQKNFIVNLGSLGLKSLECGKLSYMQIEACRKSIRRNIKKKGKVYIKVFTYFSVTKKPLATRMGKGKGTHKLWICPIRKGQIICEVGGVKKYIAYKALKSAASRLPICTSIIRNYY